MLQHCYMLQCRRILHRNKHLEEKWLAQSHCLPLPTLYRLVWNGDLLLSVQGFLAKILQEQQGGEPCPLVRKRTALLEHKLHRHLPCISKHFHKSQLHQVLPRGFSSDGLQLRSHSAKPSSISPAQFAPTLYFMYRTLDLPEREQWMGNSGTIIISSGVQQGPFPISKQVKQCLPLPWPETASDLHCPGYQTPVFRTAHPFAWRGFSIDTGRSGIKRWSISNANKNHAVEYEKCTGGESQRWKWQQCFLGCCLFPSTAPAGKGVTLPVRRGKMKCPYCKNYYQAYPVTG